MLVQALHKTTELILGLYDDFREFISPSACLCCGRIRDFEDPLLCPGCVSSLRTKCIGQGPVCPYCGRPDGVLTTCARCDSATHLKLYFWGFYDAELQTCILQFKFHKARALGLRLVDMAMHSMADSLTSQRYDLIIPVPLHKSRVREREYNQSEVLSERLAISLNIDHQPGALVRHKHTRQQAKLEEQERWTNVRDAFELCDEHRHLISGKRILLVDDIVTTGATIYEASRPLLAAEATAVDIFSLAYAK